MALNSFCPYSSDSSDSEESTELDHVQEESSIADIINRMLIKVERNIKRKDNNTNENDSDHSDTDQWCIDWDEELEDFDNDHYQPCITKGELTFDDLPKIERLNISSSIEELTQVGIISSIVNQLVIVQSFTSVPVLDLDSILFNKHGSELGPIFDVIGPVKQPNYVLRFNSVQEIREFKLDLNTAVYYNHNFPEPLTKYVFINNLMKEKGSDASWKDNNEPPPEALDYSDDETERVEKWKRIAKSRQRNSTINID